MEMSLSLPAERLESEQLGLLLVERRDFERLELERLGFDQPELERLASEPASPPQV